MSYDDSMIEDIKLVELLNKYHIKATFNINTGLYDWKKERHCQPDVQKKIYVGHEVAVHTFLHKHLEELSDEEIYQEIKKDKDNIKKMFSVDPVGMAYPFGTYDKRVIKIAKELGIKYSRTIISTHNFEVCKTPMELTATCHHNDPELMNYAKKFVDLDKTKKDYVFYVWGHSYEFDEDNTKLNFEQLEDFLKLIANHKDIMYLTNAEVLRKLNLI
jgi:peptidoglycan/xylan/chitin deacetylase (PgdA/CDA1 family)